MSRPFAVVAALVFAGVSPAQDRPRAVTPDDYASIATITEIAVSHQGKHVAYCEARWDAATDGRKTDLWVVATHGRNSPHRLTFDGANVRHPKWSADGSYVYVLANLKRAAETAPPYDGKTQVWRIPAEGGEPFAVTRVPGGVAGYDLAPKGSGGVFYTVDATATDDDSFTKLRAKHKAEYGHGTRKVSELYRLDLGTWHAKKVVDEKRYIREFAVTPNGNKVAMVTAADDTVIRSEGGSRVDVWDWDVSMTSRTDDGWKDSAASPYPWLEGLAWNAEGTQFAFCTVFDAYPAEVVVQTWDGGKWTASRVDRGPGVHVRGYGSPLGWKAETALGFLAEFDGRVALAGYETKARRLTFDSHTTGVASSFSYQPGGESTFLVYSPAGGRPEVVAAAGSTTLTQTNPDLGKKPLPSVQHITWLSAFGVRVGGVLELPPGYKKGDRLPLIVAIHGGPTTSTKADLSFDPHNGRLYLSARGYAVLCPNYRGSTGYGDKFVTDLIGNENDLDVKDILAGVRYLIDSGIADPERVGVMGWSNGGYLTNCLITLENSPVKFKAASSGAGILDTVAEWGFNDEPAYPVVFKKGPPWKTPDVYRKTSPTYGLGNVATPTLIHVGGNDERCPPGHSRMLYRALREYQKIPTELVVYPGEPHGLTKLSHRKAKMEWDIAWFDKYLLGK
jgi:dipeptidyl aminopeptidase/acylaminoacyl peptidase